MTHRYEEILRGRAQDTNEPTNDRSTQVSPRPRVETPAVAQIPAARPAMMIVRGRELNMAESGRRSEKRGRSRMGSLVLGSFLTTVVLGGGGTFAAYRMSEPFKETVDERLLSIASMFDRQADETPVETVTVDDVEFPEIDDTLIVPTPSIEPVPDESPSPLADPSQKPATKPLTMNMFTTNVDELNVPQTSALSRRMKRADVAVMAVQGIRSNAQYETVRNALGDGYEATRPWDASSSAADQITFYNSSILTKDPKTSGEILVPGEDSVTKTQLTDAVPYDTFNTTENGIVTVFNFDIQSTETKTVRQKSKVFDSQAIVKREEIASAVVKEAKSLKQSLGKNAVIVLMGDAGAEKTDRPIDKTSYSFFTKDSDMEHVQVDAGTSIEEVTDLRRRQIYVSDDKRVEVAKAEPVGMYGNVYSTLGYLTELSIMPVDTTDITVPSPSDAQTPQSVTKRNDDGAQQ